MQPIQGERRRRDCYAVGGIDLSQTTDLTAASVVIQKDGTLYAFTQFFMPRGRLEYLQATDGVPYDIFVKKGLITLSGENYVDYHDVYGWFTMLLEDYGIRPLKIGYDRYSAQYLIHHYFQSIDHAVLKTEIRKVIKDAGVLALLDRIIDHNGNMPDGVGIPVGNLTSQLFANIYLDALDQFIKHELGVEAYIRYMDDFVILSPDKEQLRSWLARIEQFLREELKLEFNPKTTILAAKNGIDFVGYKHRATHRKVRKDSIKRIKRTIKKCESGKITKEQLQKSIQSWTGHAGHADSYNLRKKIETLAEAAIEKAA